jgi:endonuclease/exonuclease/phosphatase family metal-dependent hydrolase
MVAFPRRAGTRRTLRRTRSLATGLIAALALIATLALSVVGASTATATGPTLDGLAGAATLGDLDVMTFNLRYADATGPNSWTVRRPVMRDLLLAEHPDLIGTQEGLTGQLADIESDLGSQYAFIGTGREGGTLGEYAAIFYDTTRLAPQEHQDFWLSDTPEVPGSNTWGGGSIRMVTWVRFLDHTTGGQFYAVNTHLDNASALARLRAAELIQNRLAALDPTLPVVITGDFNDEANTSNPVYDLLVRRASYVDSWTAAANRGALYGTFHDYWPLVTNGPRIDWILTTPGVSVSAAAINTYCSLSGQYPSDHLPVQARLHLPVPALPGADPPPAPWIQPTPPW